MGYPKLMNDIDRILNSVFEAADEVNRETGSVLVEKRPEAVLFGESSKLDSLGLVNLIVQVEQIVLRDFEKTITIADERAFSMKNSPFRTVQSLADYVQVLINE